MNVQNSTCYSMEAFLRNPVLFGFKKYIAITSIVSNIKMNYLKVFLSLLLAKVIHDSKYKDNL